MKNFAHRIIFLLITLSMQNNLQAQTCAEIYKKFLTNKLYFGRILEAATILSNASELKQPDNSIKKAQRLIDDFYNKHLKNANTSFITAEIIAPLNKFNMEGYKLGLCKNGHSYYIFDPRGVGKWKNIINYTSTYDNYIYFADLLSINDKNIFLIEEFMEIAQTAQKTRKDKEEKYNDQSTKENNNQEMVTITRDEYQSLLESSKFQGLESTLREVHSNSSGS